jgi:hypothetical protein
MADERTWFKRPEVWTGCLVVLGLGLRLYHYARDPSMWHDEAALVVNVLNKSFGALLGPLTFAEAAPPLFLWLERALSLIAGDSQYVLRLIPFLASCLALVLLVPVARRVLRPEAIPWAVLLVAVSNRLLWHTCEAKPYAVEVLAATVLLALFLGMGSWPLGRQLLVWTLLAPVVIWLAYPGCFLYGGVLVALLPGVWRRRRWGVWLGYGLLSAVVAVSFLLLVEGPVQAQRCQAMTDCWLHHFPHWDRFWTVPGWTLCSTLDVVRYCIEPTGHALALVALIGALHLWRQGQAVLVLFLTVPGGLAVLAAYLHSYPWGGARVEIYLLPALALLTAAGLLPLWNWLRFRCRLAPLGLAVVVGWPAFLSACRVVDPWMRADCAGAAAYVLTHRQAGDHVIGNHWEYVYYFRRLDSAFTYLDDLTGSPGSPLWLVITGPTEKAREQMSQYLASRDWQILEQREFQQTMVCHLIQRPGAMAGLSP